MRMVPRMKEKPSVWLRPECHVTRHFCSLVIQASAKGSRWLHLLVSALGRGDPPSTCVRDIGELHGTVARQMSCVLLQGTLGGTPLLNASTQTRLVMKTW